MFQKLREWVAQRCGSQAPHDVGANVRSVEEVSASNRDTTSASDRHDKQPSIPHGYVSYFISYAYGAGGFGNCEIARGRAIRSINDLLAISRHIETTQQVQSVVILNWRQFEAEAHGGAKVPIPEGAPENVVLRLVA